MDKVTLSNVAQLAVMFASRDALINGVGFLLVGPNGELTYVDAEEVYNLAEKIKNDTQSNR